VVNVVVVNIESVFFIDDNDNRRDGRFLLTYTIGKGSEMRNPIMQNQYMQKKPLMQNGIYFAQLHHSVFFKRVSLVQNIQYKRSCN